MKKIAILMIILFVTANVHALNTEEESTARKLYDAGIFTEKRAESDWQEPIKTIDCASAIIKSLSAANDNIDERELFYSNKVTHQNKKIKLIQARVKRLEAENELLFIHKEELMKEQERLANDQVITWITVVALTFFNFLF